MADFLRKETSVENLWHYASNATLRMFEEPGTHYGSIKIDGVQVSMYCNFDNELTLATGENLLHVYSSRDEFKPVTTIPVKWDQLATGVMLCAPLQNFFSYLRPKQRRKTRSKLCTFYYKNTPFDLMYDGYGREILKDGVSIDGFETGLERVQIYSLPGLKTQFTDVGAM